MNKTDQHTPTPWKARKEYSNRWRIESEREGLIPLSVAQVVLTVSEVGCGEESENDANAAFIVRAVNCHEELLEALKGMLEYVNPSKPKKAPTIAELEKLLAQPSSPVVLTPDGKVINVECIDKARQAIAKAEAR
jgi:hypothetical protein